MPAAHLPTPANLPNLNAKSAGAPPVRWRHEREDDGGRRKDDVREERRGTRKAKQREYERQKDRYGNEKRTSEKGVSEK